MIDPEEKMKLIELTAPNPKWPSLFVDAAAEIKSILQENCVAIHHIGSTSIPHIYAKPIIDIMPVVKDLSIVDRLNPKFETLGYVCMGEYGISNRRFYWKSKQIRTHNIHLFEQGSVEVSRVLAFKEFLIQHEDYAQTYSLLKCELAKEFSQDIESYVNGKASFVQMIAYKTLTADAAQLAANDNIIIKPYNPLWPKLAAAEVNVIKKICGRLPHVSIEHLGSTAVPKLSSKPVIDIFITVKSITDAKLWVKPLESFGYLFWEDNPDKTHLRFFKGMPPFGKERTHHIHIAETEVTEHRIIFRDILRKDEKIRREYEELKLKLSSSHASDREVYTASKSEFIKAALRAYGYNKL